MAGAESRKRGPSPIFHLLAALGLQAIMVALIGSLIGPHAWDDGAITLAFSKTFAETGRIALTATSEQVEGFSSVAWFLVNALVARFHLSFEATILASQIAAGIFLGIATIFIWLIARRTHLRSDTTAAILLTFSIFGPSISEVSNGMEMTLLAASGVAFVYALYVRENRLLLVLAALVFLTSRFEAMIYYAALLAPLLFQRRFRIFFALAAVGLMVVCLQEIARFLIFGDLIPNTIEAKMQPPYRHSGIGAAWVRLRGGTEVAEVLFPLVLATSAFALTRTARMELIRCLRAPATISDQALVLLAPIVAVVLFSILIGKNWGYSGRMQFLALPFVLLVCGLLFDRFAPFEGLSSVRTIRAMLFGVSIVTVLFSWSQSAEAPLKVMALKVAGKGSAVTDQFDVTPASYYETGLVVDQIRKLSGMETIAFLTADIGGLGLCCSRIRVVDIGLLTNRRLARAGYRAFPEVFANENPDVIEVHSRWASLADIYNLPAFNDGYQAALVGRTRLYVRDAIVDRLIRNSHGRFCRIDDNQCLIMAIQIHRYAEHTYKVDDVAFLKRERVFIVGE